MTSHRCFRRVIVAIWMMDAFETDLSAFLEVSDDSVNQQFWTSKHTAIHLTCRSTTCRASLQTDDEIREPQEGLAGNKNKESLITAVGCEDGSIWLLEAGQCTLQPGAVQTDAGIRFKVTNTDDETLERHVLKPRSVKQGSPTPSRDSASSFYNTNIISALSPPSVSISNDNRLASSLDNSAVDLNSTISPGNNSHHMNAPGNSSNRHRATSSVSTATTRTDYSMLGISPTKARPQSTRTSGTASPNPAGATAASRLTSISAASASVDSTLRIKLRGKPEPAVDQDQPVQGSFARSDVNITSELKEMVDEESGEADDSVYKSVPRPSDSVLSRSPDKKPHDMPMPSNSRPHNSRPVASRTTTDVRYERQMDSAVTEALKEDQEREKIKQAVEDVEQGDQSTIPGCRDCPSDKGSTSFKPEPSIVDDAAEDSSHFLAHLTPNNSNGNPIVAILSILSNSRQTTSPLLVALSKNGICSIIDLNLLKIVNQLDLNPRGGHTIGSENPSNSSGQSIHAQIESCPDNRDKRSVLTPPLTWLGMQAVPSHHTPGHVEGPEGHQNEEGSHTFLAYAHPATDSPMDPAKDTTTTVLFGMSTLGAAGVPTPMTVFGSNILPGLGSVAVGRLTLPSDSPEPRLFLLHSSSSGNSVERYSMRTIPPPPVVDDQHPKSHMDLSSFWPISPLPSRPQSRAGVRHSDEQDKQRDKEQSQALLGVPRPSSPAPSLNTPGSSTTSGHTAANAADFGKMLGKRLLSRAFNRGDHAHDAASHDEKRRVFHLGSASTVVIPDTEQWKGIKLWGSRGLLWGQSSCQVS